MAEGAGGGELARSVVSAWDRYHGCELVDAVATLSVIVRDVLLQFGVGSLDVDRFSPVRTIGHGCGHHHHCTTAFYSGAQ